MSQEIEIGLGKKGRLGYALDDVAIVPSRRTRDPEDVSTSWQIDAYEFDVPVIGAPMDSVTSPATAIAMGKMGALGVLDLEGLWTRYEDPTPLLDEIAGLRPISHRAYPADLCRAGQAGAHHATSARDSRRRCHRGRRVSLRSAPSSSTPPWWTRAWTCS